MTWTAPEVERPQGPLTGPERPMLQAFLDSYRVTLLHKCAGLTGEQLAERAVPPSSLSLLGLVRHMTKVERIWFRQRFAGEPVGNPFGDETDADFNHLDPARAAADYARLTEEFKLADAAVANASLDDTFTSRGEVMSLRLIYLHMIEEYARHVGHADLLRERTDGVTGH
ncbi:MAG: DinB family protein [Streptosporangiaceae bacterium]